MTKKIHEEFKSFLEKHDGRYSTQKKVILTEILKIKKHFEIEEFLLKLYKKNQKIGRATVYRTVKQLLEAGLIQKISTKTERYTMKVVPTKSNTITLYVMTVEKSQK